MPPLWGLFSSEQDFSGFFSTCVLHWARGELQFEPTRVYGLDGGGRLVAEITFPCTQPGIYTIDHTFVDPSLRGQGMADKLVRAALEQIRKNGGTPAATCTYAVSWLEKHPEQA